MSKQKEGEDSGLVVFVDIVGFSTVSVDSQKDAVDALKKWAVNPLLKRLKISKQVRNKQDQDRALILPTGDGLAVCFPISRKRLKTIRKVHLAFLADLLRWAERHNLEAGKPVQLRIGLHFGSITVLKDFNENLNSFGDTVNMAARVMNAADKGQILLHEDYVQRFIGTEEKVSIKARLLAAAKNRSSILSSRTTNITLEVGDGVEVSVKHGVALQVHPARLLINGLGLCDRQTLHPPQSASHVVVNLTPHGKPVEPTVHTPGHGAQPVFFHRLSRASEIAFIQLSGYRVVEKLEKGEIVLNSQARKLWVLMPGAESAGGMTGSEHTLRLKNHGEWVNRWKSWLIEWQKKHPDCDVRLKLFQAPPYFGASYLDWEQPGGTIHVSPYIWGKIATECPGYDMEWAGNRKAPSYQAYIDGLMELLGDRDSCEKLQQE